MTERGRGVVTEREWLGTSVDEAEWLACRTVQRPEMPDNLDYCWQRCGLLFAVACCRAVWHLIPDEPSRTAVITAEAHVDGLQGSRSCWRPNRRHMKPQKD